MKFVKNLKMTKFKDFRNQCSKIGTTEEALANAEKIGFNTKLFVKHPFIKNKTLPIYVANFVLMDYGNGQYLVVQLTIKGTSILPKNIDCRLLKLYQKMTRHLKMN